MNISDQFLSIDSSQVLDYFGFEVKESTFPYISFFKNGFPQYLLYKPSDQGLHACFNTQTLSTITSAELFMQISINTHFQALSEQVKAVIQTAPLRTSFTRILNEREIISHFLRLFTFRSNQYIESSGFDLEETQFKPISNHLFFHDDNTCAMLLYHIERKEPSNTLYFGEGFQSMASADQRVLNSVITNPEFPNLLCAFPHQLLLHLHHAGESSQRYNYHFLSLQPNASVLKHLLEQLPPKPALHFLHGDYAPMLIHNFQLQINLIYLYQITEDGKTPYLLQYDPDIQNLTGTLTVAKPAGAWSRRDTSLFSAMNIQASMEFSNTPETYIQEQVDDYRLFSYNRFSEPALQGIRIRFHFKSQLFKIAIQVLLDKVQIPFSINFTHLNNSFT